MFFYAAYIRALMLDNSIDGKLEPPITRQESAQGHARPHGRRFSISLLMRPRLNVTAADAAPMDGAINEGMHIWRSCCIEMDSRALLFFSQLVITLFVLGFCVEQVVTLDESHSQWQRMTISLLCGIWLPAPRVQK
jgi:hypothetical protein